MPQGYYGAGRIEQNGWAYCEKCNKVSAILERCEHGRSEFSEAHWSEPYVECCFAEDGWNDLEEIDEARAVIEMLAKKLDKLTYSSGKTEP